MTQDNTQGAGNVGQEYQNPGGYGHSAPAEYGSGQDMQGYQQADQPQGYQPQGYGPQGYGPQGFGQGGAYAGAYGGLPTNYDQNHPPRPSVGFGKAIKLFFKNYANFYGRASVSEYWWPVVAYLVVYLLLVGIGIGPMIAAASAQDDTAMVAAGGGFTILMSILGLLSLAVVIPSLSSAVRRLHDTGKSGFWYFISFVPLIGGIWLLVLLVSGAKPEGVRFDNPYGTQPKVD